MQRFAPLLAVIGLLLILALMYGPQAYRNWTFQRDVETMLAAARSGNTAGMVANVDPGQQAEAKRIFDAYLPADYAQRIDRLTLSGGEDGARSGRYALVTCRMSESSNVVIYQGKLLWKWNGKHWTWDFGASQAAPLSLSGDTQWYKLSDILEEARAY